MASRTNPPFWIKFAVIVGGVAATLGALTFFVAVMLTLTAGPPWLLEHHGVPQQAIEVRAQVTPGPNGDEVRLDYEVTGPTGKPMHRVMIVPKGLISTDRETIQLVQRTDTGETSLAGWPPEEVWVQDHQYQLGQDLARGGAIALAGGCGFVILVTLASALLAASPQRPPTD